MTVNRINWEFDLTLTDSTRELLNPQLSVSWKLINMLNLGPKPCYLISLSGHLASNVFLLVTPILFLQSPAQKYLHRGFWCSFFSGTEDRMTAAGDISIKSQSRDERVNVYKYPDNSFFPDDSWSWSLWSHRAQRSGSLFSLIFTWLSRSLVSEQCQTLSRCIVEWEQNIQWLNDTHLNINFTPFISNSVGFDEKKVKPNKL